MKNDVVTHLATCLKTKERKKILGWKRDTPKVQLGPQVNLGHPLVGPHVSPIVFILGYLFLIIIIWSKVSDYWLVSPKSQHQDILTIHLFNYPHAHTTESGSSILLQLIWTIGCYWRDIFNKADNIKFVLNGPNSGHFTCSTIENVRCTQQILFGAWALVICLSSSND